MELSTKAVTPIPPIEKVISCIETGSTFLMLIILEVRNISELIPFPIATAFNPRKSVASRMIKEAPLVYHCCRRIMSERPLVSIKSQLMVAM